MFPLHIQGPRGDKGDKVNNSHSQNLSLLLLPDKMHETSFQAIKHNYGVRHAVADAP